MLVDRYASVGICRQTTAINPELNPELNLEPRALGYPYNKHANDGLLADFDPLLSPTSTHSLRPSPVEIDITGDSAGSNDCSLPCNRNTPLHVPTTNMATLVQCSPNTQGHGESSLVIADSENTGALQQVMTAALKNSRGRNRVLVDLKPVVNCECDACWYRQLRWKSPVDKLAPKDKAHSSIELCKISDCDSRYGIRRMPDTEHLFTAQICHGRNIRCCCAAQSCTFVCER